MQGDCSGQRQRILLLSVEFSGASYRGIRPHIVQSPCNAAHVTCLSSLGHDAATVCLTVQARHEVEANAVAAEGDTSDKSRLTKALVEVGQCQCSMHVLSS